MMSFSCRRDRLETDFAARRYEKGPRSIEEILTISKRVVINDGIARGR